MVPSVMAHSNNRMDRVLLTRALLVAALLAVEVGCGANARVLESEAGGTSNTSGAAGASSTSGAATGGANTLGGSGAATGGANGSTGGATGLWSGGASGTGTTTACGDPQVESRWETCRSAADEAACQAEGGNWVVSHQYCDCPTGQGGCPCTRRSQCHGACLGDWDGECTQLQGQCTSTALVLGCHCFFWDESGIPQAVCVD